MEAVIHHEVGEALETSLGPAFATLLDLFPQSRVELWLRALKDALAEVNESGRLSYLIEGRRLAFPGADAGPAPAALRHCSCRSWSRPSAA